jgi:hypothetical protein
VSLSLKTSEFTRKAEELARDGTAVLYVNAGCVRPWSKPWEVLAAFATFPWQVAGLPSRIRWGPAGLETALTGDTPWRPTVPADAPAVTLLPDGTGLLLDLGAWWTAAFPPREPVDA